MYFVIVTIGEPHDVYKYRDYLGDSSIGLEILRHQVLTISLRLGSL